jgi:hypothetical protein
MRILTLIAIVFIIWIKGFTQSFNEFTYTRPLNSVNINLLGDISLISINYERYYLINPSFVLNSKLGVGLNPESPCCGTIPPIYITIPHHISGNIGKGKHFFEFGLGGTIIGGYDQKPYLLYPILGYRFLPIESGKVNFRFFGLLPFSGSLGADEIYILPVGFNVGISF